MEKRVTLKLNDGSLSTGFLVNLQVGYEDAAPTVEVVGRLPAAPELRSHYQQWQVAYQQFSSPGPLRLGKSLIGFATNVSYVEDCHQLADNLQRAFNQWLRAESFRPVQDKLLEQLNPDDTIRLIVQTQQDRVQRLPWHLWDICDRYPNLEIALSAPIYEKKTPAVAQPRHQVRILAVLGASQGLDIETDLALLNHLPNANIQCLTEPDRQTLDTHLWDPQGWDILFFAGHSSTQTPAQTPVQENTKNNLKSNLTGQFSINATDTITIPQLKHALQTAVSRGLQIAIFNSCDGLGLAQALADLQIPQILVMQEMVSDQVAHTFLKSFLDAFAQGKSFYLAVREAREKLQGLEDKFPCATWLPTIYQNPANTPPRWSTLLGLPPSTPAGQPPGAIPTHKLSQHQQRILAARLPLQLFLHAAITVAIIGLRHLGLLAGWELKAFDKLITLRPRETADSRLLVVTVTENDIQPDENRRGSLSDQSLLAILKRLELMQPRVIGLDIYRDFAVNPLYPELANLLATEDNFFAVCKSRDSIVGNNGIPPPPEVSENQVGFSDFLADTDGILRRHLLHMTPEPASPCTPKYSFNALLALKYLSTESVTIQASPEGYLQIGDILFSPIDSNEGSYQGIDARGHQLLLNYRSLASPEHIADSVTLTELIEGQVNPESIRDRIVLIGTTDASYGDLWRTPYTQGAKAEHQTSGVFMQAQMTSHLLSAVLDGRPLLKTWPDWGEDLWILLWGGLSSLIIFGLKANHKNTALSHWVVALCITELGLFSLCWLVLVKTAYWLPWIPPAIVLMALIGMKPTVEHFILFQNSMPSYKHVKE